MDNKSKLCYKAGKIFIAGKIAGIYQNIKR